MSPAIWSLPLAWRANCESVSPPAGTPPRQSSRNKFVASMGWALSEGVLLTDQNAMGAIHLAPVRGEAYCQNESLMESPLR